MPARLEGFDWLTDAQGQMTRCGPALARWLGATPDMVCELQMVTVHPEDQGHCAAVFGEALAMRQPWEMVIRLRRRDEVWVWCVLMGEPVWRGVLFQGFRGVTAPGDVFVSAAWAAARA